MRRLLIAAALMLGALPAAAQPAKESRMPPPSPEVIAALAPTGKLIAAINYGNAVLARRDPATGALSGATVDMANELGRRLGKPVQLIGYEAVAPLIAAQPTDRWDVCFVGSDPERAKLVDFTAPYVLIEGTYLVREDSPYKAVADLDKPGLRVTVSKGAAYDLALTRQLKNAQIDRVATTSKGAIERFQTEGFDAGAGIRPELMLAQAERPGYRVLPDAYASVTQSMGTPVGRGPAAAYLSAFVEELKANGFIRAALDRAGQPGATIAP